MRTSLTGTAPSMSSFSAKIPGPRELISDQLTSEGYRVTFFSDRTELLETLRAGKPNLLICDATEPGQDGYDVCREIKADDDLWRVPVLLLTGEQASATS